MLAKRYTKLLPPPAIAGCTSAALNTIGNGIANYLFDFGNKSCITLAPAVSCPYIICYVSFLRDEWSIELSLCLRKIGLNDRVPHVSSL